MSCCRERVVQKGELAGMSVGMKPRSRFDCRAVASRRARARDAVITCTSPDLDLSSFAPWFSICAQPSTYSGSSSKSALSYLLNIARIESSRGCQYPFNLAHRPLTSNGTKPNGTLLQDKHSGSRIIRSVNYWEVCPEQSNPVS